MIGLGILNAQGRVAYRRAVAKPSFPLSPQSSSKPSPLTSRPPGTATAFQYGVPPHGGFAAGIDRIVMLLLGVQNVRDISLFPMNQQAMDLLMNGPIPATNSQLTELGIRVVKE